MSPSNRSNPIPVSEPSPKISDNHQLDSPPHSPSNFVCVCVCPSFCQDLYSDTVSFFQRYVSPSFTGEVEDDPKGRSITSTSASTFNELDESAVGLGSLPCSPECKRHSPEIAEALITLTGTFPSSPNEESDNTIPSITHQESSPNTVIKSNHGCVKNVTTLPVIAAPDGNNTKNMSNNDIQTNINNIPPRSDEDNLRNNIKLESGLPQFEPTEASQISPSSSTESVTKNGTKPNNVGKSTHSVNSKTDDSPSNSDLNGSLERLRSSPSEQKAVRKLDYQHQESLKAAAFSKERCQVQPKPEFKNLWVIESLPGAKIEVHPNMNNETQLDQHAEPQTPSAIADTTERKKQMRNETETQPSIQKQTSLPNLQINIQPHTQSISQSQSRLSLVKRQQTQLLSTLSTPGRSLSSELQLELKDHMAQKKQPETKKAQSHSNPEMAAQFRSKTQFKVKTNTQTRSDSVKAITNSTKTQSIQSTRVTSMPSFAKVGNALNAGINGAACRGKGPENSIKVNHRLTSQKERINGARSSFCDSDEINPLPAAESIKRNMPNALKSIEKSKNLMGITRMAVIEPTAQPQASGYPSASKEAHETRFDSLGSGNNTVLLGKGNNSDEDDSDVESDNEFGSAAGSVDGNFPFSCSNVKQSIKYEIGEMKNVVEIKPYNFVTISHANKHSSQSSNYNEPVHLGFSNRLDRPPSSSLEPSTSQPQGQVPWEQRRMQAHALKNIVRSNANMNDSISNTKTNLSINEKEMMESEALKPPGKDSSFESMMSMDKVEIDTTNDPTHTTPGSQVLSPKTPKSKAKPTILSPDAAAFVPSSRSTTVSSGTEGNTNSVPKSSIAHLKEKEPLKSIPASPFATKTMSRSSTHEDINLNRPHFTEWTSNIAMEHNDEEKSEHSNRKSENRPKENPNDSLMFPDSTRVSSKYSEHEGDCLIYDESTCDSHNIDTQALEPESAGFLFPRVGSGVHRRPTWDDINGRQNLLTLQRNVSRYYPGNGNGHSGNLNEAFH